MTITMIIALAAIIVALVVLYIPNRYIDTTGCKRNWLVVFTILTGSAFLAKMDDLGFVFLVLLFLGICLNYAAPFLLNVITAFNRKSDPCKKR